MLEAGIAALAFIQSPAQYGSTYSKIVSGYPRNKSEVVWWSITGYLAIPIS